MDSSIVSWSQGKAMVRALTWQQKVETDGGQDQRMATEQLIVRKNAKVK